MRVWRGIGGSLFRQAAKRRRYPAPHGGAPRARRMPGLGGPIGSGDARARAGPAPPGRATHETPQFMAAIVMK